MRGVCMNNQELAKEIWNMVAIKGAGQKKIEALLNKERPERYYCFGCGCDKQPLTCSDCNIKRDEENAKLKVELEKANERIDELEEELETEKKDNRYDIENLERKLEEAEEKKQGDE